MTKLQLVRWYHISIFFIWCFARKRTLWKTMHRAMFHAFLLLTSSQMWSQLLWLAFRLQILETTSMWLAGATCSVSGHPKKAFSCEHMKRPILPLSFQPIEHTNIDQKRDGWNLWQRWCTMCFQVFNKGRNGANNDPSSQGVVHYHSDALGCAQEPRHRDRIQVCDPTRGRLGGMGRRAQPTTSTEAVTWLNMQWSISQTSQLSQFIVFEHGIPHWSMTTDWLTPFSLSGTQTWRNTAGLAFVYLFLLWALGLKVVQPPHSLLILGWRAFLLTWRAMVKFVTPSRRSYQLLHQSWAWVLWRPGQSLSQRTRWPVDSTWQKAINNDKHRKINHASTMPCTFTTASQSWRLHARSHIHIHFIILLWMCLWLLYTYCYTIRLAQNFAAKIWPRTAMEWCRLVLPWQPCRWSNRIFHVWQNRQRSGTWPVFGSPKFGFWTSPS